jgi:hypothetical protein
MILLSENMRNLNDKGQSDFYDLNRLNPPPADEGPFPAS